MTRPPSPIAALLLLVISLLAVTHCHTVAVAADHAAVAVSDENGLSSNPTLAAEAGASAKEALPAEQQQHGIEFLRLPSRRPCGFIRHPLLWKPRHRVYTRDPACMFDDYDSGDDDDGERRKAVSDHDILPGAEARETTEKVKPVAEPDPDRSLPDSDGEGELVASREPSSSFADTDGHDGEPWKEMLRKWVRYAYFHFHHGTRRHRLHLKQEQEATPETTASMNMKRLHHAEHDHNEDNDDDGDEEVEEMVRRFRKALMRIRRRRFGHDAEHGHRHAEEAEMS